MDTIKCACGCGQSRSRFDKKGRERFFIRGHENRRKTDAQRAAAAAAVNRVRPVVPWNKGKTYVHERKRVYANKGAWNKALRRLFPDRCMRCGWEEGSCDTHHIVPRSNGGEYTLENGAILCPNCHRLADFGIVGIDELRRLRGV